jgi:poly-gamma-glutamate synthesis protein (capsule biosynthesis protein)
VPERPWQSEEIVVANLEGDIISSPSDWIDRKVVFNSRSVPDYLERMGVKVVSLANNHIFDVHESILPTLSILDQHGIGACGAGDSLSEARQPYLIREGTPPVALIAFGWEPIQCRTASNDSPGVNPLTPANVLNSVQQVEESYPEAKTVLYMHWNYELELYPQPMHRQLALRAVDAGADAVVGTHSHRVQGIEVYRGAPIVHGLGNWLFAQNEFYDGTLSFPDCASLELAFQWKVNSGEMVCHWFEYDRVDHSIYHISSDKLERSRLIESKTPYSGAGQNEYIDFFKDNRIKRKLLPAFYHCNSKIKNKLKNKWVYLRGKVIQSMVHMGLKSASR